MKPLLRTRKLTPPASPAASDEVAQMAIDAL